MSSIRHFLIFLCLQFIVMIAEAHHFLCPPLPLAYVMILNIRSIQMDDFILFFVGLFFDFYLDTGLIGQTALGYIITQKLLSIYLMQKSEWTLIELILCTIVVAIGWIFWSLITLWLADGLYHQAILAFFIHYSLLLPLFILCYYMICAKNRPDQAAGQH
jgi:hypothetical protein